jgi:hypothetical protein
MVLDALHVGRGLSSMVEDVLGFKYQDFGAF